MVVWREAEVNYLIDLIRSHEFIWNTAAPDYKQKHKKFKFWGFAAYKINTAFNRMEAFDRKDCFKKWNNLRTYFQSESKTSKTRTENDSSETKSKGFICNSWKYSSRLSFLNDAQLPNIADNSESSICEVDPYSLSEVESCDAMIVPEESAVEHHHSPSMDKPHELYSEANYTNHKTEISSDSHEDPLQDKLSVTMSHQSNKDQETPSYFFGRYVSQCLDKLDADINLEARQRINEILFNCERMQLQRH